MKKRILKEQSNTGVKRFNFFPIASLPFGSTLSQVAEIFGDIATVIKGELKRTLSSVGFFIDVTFSFPLKRADEYKQMFADHNKKMEKINSEVGAALDRLSSPGANAFMFCLNPGLVMGLAAREQMSTITPEKIDEFWDDYGLSSVPILGGVSRGVVKAGVGAGQFATMSSPNYNFKIEDDGKGGTTKTSSVKDAETTLVDRLAGIFLFRNPFKSMGEGVVVEKRKMGNQDDPVVAAAQSFLDGFSTVMKNKKGKYEVDGDSEDDENLLLDEQEEVEQEKKPEASDEDEFDKFVELANMASKDIMDNQGKQLVAAHKELLDQLLPDLAAQVQTAIAITKAETFEDFSAAVESSESKEVQSIDITGLASELEDSAIEIANDPETLKQFLEGSNKSLEDFGIETPEEKKPADDDKAKSDETSEGQSEPQDLSGNTELLSWIVEALYQKELAPQRIKIFEGLEQTFNEAYDAILGQLTGEDQLQQVKGTPIGNEFAAVCEDGLNKLKQIFNDFLQVQGG